MPRGKRAEQPVQVPSVQTENGTIEPNFQDQTDEQLVQKYVELRDWTQAEKKRFDTFMEPHKQTMDIIENEFLRRLNERGADSTKTDCGTAYKSTLLNISVTPEGSAPYIRPDAPASIGREALLDFALDNWDEIGNELLLISAQKDSVRRWMDEHQGVPPPGIKVNWFTKVNIRRS